MEKDKGGVVEGTVEVSGVRVETALLRELLMACCSSGRAW